MTRTAKLSEAQVEAIRELFDGEPRPTYAEIGERFGLHPDTVRKIVNYQRRLPAVAERRADARKPPGKRLSLEQVKAIRLAFFQDGEEGRPARIARRFHINVATVHHYLRHAHPDERRKG